MWQIVNFLKFTQLDQEKWLAPGDDPNEERKENREGSEVFLPSFTFHDGSVRGGGGICAATRFRIVLTRGYNVSQVRKAVAA